MSDDDALSHEDGGTSCKRRELVDRSDDDLKVAAFA